MKYCSIKTEIIGSCLLVLLLHFVSAFAVQILLKLKSKTVDAVDSKVSILIISLLWIVPITAMTNIRRIFVTKEDIVRCFTSVAFVIYNSNIEQAHIILKLFPGDHWNVGDISSCDGDGSDFYSFDFGRENSKQSRYHRCWSRTAYSLQPYRSQHFKKWKRCKCGRFKWKKNYENHQSYGVFTLYCNTSTNIF